MPVSLTTDIFHRQGYRLVLAGGLLCALALAGGSYRFDEERQFAVRLTALWVIAASLWPLEFKPLRQMRWQALGFAAIAMLPLLQLVPLPPSLWASLSGHAVYAQIAVSSGTETWRPLSLTPDLTVNALASLLVPAAAGLAAIYLDWRGQVRLAHGFVGLACLSALLGVLQLAAGGDALRLYHPSSEGAPVGLFANRNHQAALMACALPLASALAAIRIRDLGQRRAVTIALIPAMIVFLGVLIATGSRMGLVLGIIGLGGAAWCWRAARQPFAPSQRGMRLGLAAATLAGLAVAAVGAVRSGIAGRLLVSDFADETRIVALTPMSEAARAFFPFGAGFGSFESVFPRFEPTQMLSTVYLNAAHNEPMQLTIEGGLPALALLLAFFVWWLRSAIGALRPSDSARKSALAAAMVCVTVILLTASLADYPLRTPILSALFAFACVHIARAGSLGERNPAIENAEGTRRSAI